MKPINIIAFRIVIASLVLCSCYAVGIQAQTPNASPAKSPAPKTASQSTGESSGLRNSKLLPSGIRGSNAEDPRARLKSGLYDAGEAALGIRHLTLLRKPDSFQLGSLDAASPRVKQTLVGTFGIPEAAPIPPSEALSLAALAFANSDLAFQGNHLFMGNFYGMNIYDISDPAKARLLTSIVCPGGQGDVSVYKNLMFMSVEMQNGRIDCGTQGFPLNPPPADGQEMAAPAAQKDRFRGVRIFDISDIRNPKQVAAVQTCRGSHTHTLVTDPKDKSNVYIYVSGTSFVRPAEELAGCSGGPAETDPNTAYFRIEVIKVPLAAPQDAKIVSAPRIFADIATGDIRGLQTIGRNDADEPSSEPSFTDQCHDITVYSEIGLAAGACSGHGILLDIRDPANPKRIEAVSDPNFAYWHSASFSNDGKKVIFTDEWGGGMGARCRENDPNVWGANAVFRLAGNKLTFANYYKLPAAQTESENCVAHNGSLIPVPGRDIKVQAWYQGGISVMDFTDPSNPTEIAYFDRGPVDPKILVLGGHWSAYWYNGHIYASEIVRGLDILELVPTKHLTQNEIDAAKSVRVAELNVQNQEKIEWPRKLVVAKAYVDQLERSQALPSGQITRLRQAIQRAEGSKLNQKDAGRLRSLAASLEKSARGMKNAADSARSQALAELLRQPAI